MISNLSVLMKQTVWSLQQISFSRALASCSVPPIDRRKSIQPWSITSRVLRVHGCILLYSISIFSLDKPFLTRMKLLGRSWKEVQCWHGICGSAKKLALCKTWSNWPHLALKTWPTQGNPRSLTWDVRNRKNTESGSLKRLITLWIHMPERVFCVRHLYVA